MNLTDSFPDVMGCHQGTHSVHGMEDMLISLGWINDWIGQFDGDHRRITVAGLG